MEKIKIELLLNHKNHKYCDNIYNYLYKYNIDNLIKCLGNSLNKYNNSDDINNQCIKYINENLDTITCLIKYCNFLSKIRYDPKIKAYLYVFNVIKSSIN